MKIILVLLSVFLSLSAIAQTTITGNVTDGITHENLALAAITLTNDAKTLIALTDADENGYFKLAIPNTFTQGILTVRYVSYSDFNLNLYADKIPGALQVVLQPKSKELDEVTVTAKQKAVTISGDKVIFNVDKLGIGNGTNGLEAVRQIPGIRLDKDDNIQFRGSSDVQIMINGRRSLLQGDALREFIRSLKGSDIQYVEVIAQPSARYDAAGTTGILNIVLKKSKAGGVSGNIYSYISYGEYFKHQNGGQLFYNDSLWNINANGYYYNGNSVNHREVNQTIQIENGVRKLNQSNEWLPHTLSKNINVGVERKLGSNHLLSTAWNYFKSDDDDNTYGTTYEFVNEEPVNEVKLTQYFLNPNERLTGNVFYNFTADSTAAKLDVQANYARYKNQKNGFQRNDYADASFMKLDGFNNTSYTVATIQADWVQKLSKKLTLEGGLKYSDVRMNYFNEYNTNNAPQLVIPDSLLINHFSYKEQLGAAYTQLSLNLDKWSFLAGLRAEYYKYNATSRTNNQTSANSFTNWFPSFSANYKKEYNQYQLSYSRRIGRPGYLELNPYYQYIDAYTLERGNPALRPQLYHSFQVSYVYKSALNISLYGYLYDNGFINVIDYLEAQNYNVTYKANAATGNRFGLSASLPYEPFDWWTMQLSLDANYNSERSNVQNFSYSGSGFGYEANLYENINLKNNWSLTLNGFYSGRATTANGYMRATYDISVSAKKHLLDKKLQVLGGCANILKKSLYHQVTQVDNVTTNWTNRWETRRFYLQLTYYIGSGKSKKVKTATLNEESERM